MKKNIKYKIALMLTAVLVQSCKVTQDYTRPDLHIPDSFNKATSENKSSVLEIPSYQHFFTDQDLLVILDKVLEYNLDLLIASEHILASEAMLKSTKQNYLPEINMQINANMQQLSKNGVAGNTAAKILAEEYTMAPAVSWDIDFWGKLKRQREGALSTFLSQAENRRALRVQLIAQTTQAYYNLLSLDAQLRIAQAVEKSMQETLTMLQTQYSVGEVSSLAVRQSQVQLAETRAMIPEIKTSIQTQENVLQTLTGNFPADLKRAPLLPTKAFSQELEVGIPIDLLANRPDVKQYELQLQSANARVGIAKTEFYPQLRITTQGGLNAIKTSQWLSVPASLFGNATAGITQPLLNKRHIKSAYEQSLHLRESAVLEFRKSVLIAVEEVSTSLSTIDYIKEQLSEMNNRKTAMSEAISDAQLLYKYGEANYLEVLSVQQNYFQTELAHTMILQKEINAYIALYKSLGGN